MKSLLGLSLSLNVALGMMLFFNTKKELPVVEKQMVKASEEIRPEVIETRGHVVESVPEVKKTKKQKTYRLSEMDEATYLAQSEELEQFRNELIQQLDLPEDFLEKKSKIMTESYAKVEKMYENHPAGVPMSPEQRRKLIQYEEEGYEKLEKFVGKEKFRKYKNAVDQYNKKLLDSAPEGEYSGPLLGY